MYSPSKSPLHTSARLLYPGNENLRRRSMLHLKVRSNSEGFVDIFYFTSLKFLQSYSILSRKTKEVEWFLIRSLYWCVRS